MKKKFFLIQLPFMAIILLFLLSTIRTYLGSLRDLEQLRREVSNALYAGRFAQRFERHSKEFLDALLVDGRAEVAADAELLRIGDAWKKHVAGDGGTMDPEGATLFRESMAEYETVREAERRAFILAREEGEGDRSRILIRKELEPLVKGAPLASAERYVAARERMAETLLPELSGRAGSLAIFSSESLRKSLTDLQVDVVTAMRIEMFGRSLARQVRGYSELLIDGEKTAGFRIAEARRKARDALSAWRSLAAARREKGERPIRETPATEAIEVAWLRLDAAGAEIEALAGRGAASSARERIRREVNPLYAAILAETDAVAEERREAIAAGLEAVGRDAGRMKAEIAVAGILFLGVGAGSILLLLRSMVTPVLRLREMADRVGAGDLEAKVDIASGDEVGDLARSFNAMTDSLTRTTVTREHFDNILQSILSCVFVIGPDGALRTVNAATCQMLGYDREELLGRPATTLFAMDEEAEREWLADIVDRDHAANMEKICRAKEGYEIPVLCSASVIRDGEGKVLGIVCVAQDITDRIASEKALHEAHDSLTVWVGQLERRNREITLLNRLGDLLQTCLAVEEAYAVIPETASQLLPGSSGTLSILHPSRNLVEPVASWGPRGVGRSLFAPEECWGLRRGRPHLLEGQGDAVPCGHIEPPLPARAMCIPLMGAGETIGVLHVRYDGGETGEETGAAFTEPVKALAITLGGTVAMAVNNLRLRSTLREQVIRDALTGLFNRRYMEETLIREVHRAKRTNGRIGIIMIDIDHFKYFNDTFGHAAGDTVLREFGRYLRSRVRGSDLACRYGGEEFTLVLPDCPPDVAVNRAECIRTDLVQHMTLEHQGRPLGSITVSAGVAFFPDHGQMAETIIQAADAALYRAKAEGRDRVIVAASPEPRPA